MATVVGTLIFEMAANVARLQSDMQKANATVTGAMDGIKGAAAIARNALATIGIGLTVTELTGMVKASLESVEAMRELAIKTGNTVEALSSMKPAARAAKTDLEQVATGMQFLAKNMNEFATTGKGKASQAFQELGIEVTDASGKLRSSADVMREVSEKLITMEDKTKAVALAKQMLGKAGAQLLPFMEELIRIGKVHAAVSTEDAEKSHEFLVKLGQLEARSTALKREFSLGLLPALNDILVAFTSLSNQQSDVRGFGDTVGTALRWIAQGAVGAWSAMRLVGEAIAINLALLDRLKHFDFKGAWEVFKDSGAQVNKILEEQAKILERIGGAAPGVERAAEAAKKVGGASQGDVRKSEPGAGSLVAGSLAASFLGGGAASPLVNAQNLNAQLVQTRDVGREIGTVFGQSTERTVRGFTSVRDVVQKLIGDLLKMAQTQIEKSTGVGGGSSLPGIGSILKDVFAGGFAGGGTIPAGQWGIVGENGPEVAFGGSGGTSIFPGGGMGGGSFNVNIDATGADAAGLQRVEAKLEQLRQAIPGMAVGAWQRYMYRNGIATA